MTVRSSFTHVMGPGLSLHSSYVSNCVRRHSISLLYCHHSSYSCAALLFLSCSIVLVQHASPSWPPGSYTADSRWAGTLRRLLSCRLSLCHVQRHLFCHVQVVLWTCPISGIWCWMRWTACYRWALSSR